jgi:hypothetical protein
VKNGLRGTAFRPKSAGTNRKSCGKLTSTLVARLIRNPILKVLSSIQKHRVRALLMGGQACVFYGAAEFSRDTDLAILASAENLTRLKNSLRDLKAEVIAVPPFETRYLRKGHAVHFRCNHLEALGMRVDVMTKMRGVSPFSKLWTRRTTIEVDGSTIELMGLPDLVQAKKTQRDKDWPMIRRLLEVHYFANREAPTKDQVRFWFLELRTPQLLIELSRCHEIPTQLLRQRPLLKALTAEVELQLGTLLIEEEQKVREADRQYWLPLKKELEALRHARVSRKSQN